MYASWRPALVVRATVVLVGRATRVPYRAVKSGIQRTVTVTRRESLRCAGVADLGSQTTPNCMACKGSRLWHPRPQIVHMGASGPIRFPKRRSSARTYGASPAAELTRLRRKTDIKAGKGRRRVGCVVDSKGGADGPGTQSPNPAPEQAARGAQRASAISRLDLHAATLDGEANEGGLHAQTCAATRPRGRRGAWPWRGRQSSSA